MRIISGKYRGLVLAEFKGNDVRPTSDRVKESLFNILAGFVVDGTVLDLFCGSGNLGIESLSRGAKKVHFNDVAKPSIALLNKNLSKLKGENDVKITCQDYLACLNSTPLKYDLIFMDAPYAMAVCERALNVIKERNLLNDGGIVVYERDEEFNGYVKGFRLFDKRKYGKIHLSFFALDGDENE